MKAILFFLAALPAFSAWTFVKSAGNYATGSATTLTVNLATVTAGNLIIGYCKYEDATTTLAISDGTTSFTQIPAGVTQQSGDLGTSTFYLLSSVASGTVTYTCTFGGGGRPFRAIIVMEFANATAGTRSIDGNNGSAGTGTSLVSGTITTAGTDVVVVGTYGNYDGTSAASKQIGGTNADGTQLATGSVGEMWYRILTSAMVGGQATATIGAVSYVSQILAIKSVASAGGSQRRRPWVIQ